MTETHLSPAHLVLPLFVQEGAGQTPIPSMPGQARLGIEPLLAVARRALSAGVGGVALFPALADALKTPRGEESLNDDGLLQRTVRALKRDLPELVVFTDVALDPYSSDGHDGVVIDGRIDNDETVPLLAKMAVAQARAGADVVAPSDMMDGRVGAIRSALDAAGRESVPVIAYSAKFASAFYGPFREVADSAPAFGDRRSYQMDPANLREALRECALDIGEGADMIMVKPALPYLDLIRSVRDRFDVPLAAYNVSGEYAMVKAAAASGWLDERQAALESLLAIKRAGADVIFTYWAKEAAAWL